MIGRRAFLHGMIAFLPVSSWIRTGRAETLTLSSAINKAGRQRMLSQRLAKAYCQTGLNVRRDEARQQIQEGIALFESQLAELARFAPNRQIGLGIAEMEREWIAMRVILMHTYESAQVRQLVELSDRVLAKAHQVVLLIQDVSGKPFLRLVNTSGRQRMLSQRIAKLYMCRQAGLRDVAVLDNLEQVKNEFKGALTELRAAPQNSPGISMALDAAGTQWQLLEYSLTNPDKPLEEFVALTSEKILNIMDGVTASYELLPGG